MLVIISVHMLAIASAHMLVITRAHACYNKCTHACYNMLCILVVTSMHIYNNKLYLLQQAYTYCYNEFCILAIAKFLLNYATHTR